MIIRARPQYWFLSMVVGVMDTGIMFLKERYNN